MTRPQPVGCAVLAILLSLAAPSPAARPPRVAVSIQPIHSLVAAVMQGEGEPHLIVKGYGSPHAYQMRPSEAASLFDADLVFWMGVPLENFLSRPLANLKPPVRVVTLLDAEGIELLPNRDGGVWHEHDHGGHSESVADTGGRARDPHAWLSPAIAKRFVEVIGLELGRSDAGNAEHYRRNAESVAARIDAQAAAVDAVLAPVRDRPFIMFHDAFQYFERAFGLESVGALQLEPARTPGAGRVRALREAIRDRGVRCVFREPQFQSALVDTLIEGTGARVGVLDPLGADLPPGPEAWFQMMQANANAMARCLGGG